MSDELIYQSIKENKQEGFKQLVTHYKSTVEQIAFQYGLDQENIVSVVQETFVKLHRGIDRVERHDLSGSLYRATMDSLKDYRRIQTTITNNNSYKMYGYYFENLDHMVIQHALTKLDDKYKIPIILHHFHQMTLEEISFIIKANSDMLKKLIPQGMQLLHVNIEKMDAKETSIDFHHVKLSDMLDEMVYSYERLPEFTQIQELLNQVEMVGQKQKWRKSIPILVGIVGLILFSFLSVNYIQGERQRQVLKEEEASASVDSEMDDLDNEEDNQGLDPELEAYFEEAKERLAEELGIEDIDTFPTVTMVEGLLNELKSDPTYYHDDTKSYIEMLLQSPSSLKAKLDPNAIDSVDYLYQYFYLVSNYEYAFQEYLNQLLWDYDISKDDYESIVSLQEGASSYKGSEKIIEFIDVLGKQGYILTTTSEQDALTLTVKFSIENLIQYMEHVGYSDAYIAYVKYISNKEDQDWNRWESFAAYALEAEELLSTYEDSYSAFIRDSIIEDIESYLHNYLRFWENTIVTEVEKEEYNQLLANHPDSILSQVVKTTMRNWEENDWKRTEDAIRIYDMRLLFDKRYQHINYEDTLILDSWPFTPTTSTTYESYSEELNQDMLSEENPMEIVSLYAYASVRKDTDTMSSLIYSEELLDSEEESLEWFELRNSGAYALTEYQTEHSAVLFIVNWEGDPYFTINLDKDNGVWVITQIHK
ncbi:hypothetical protein KGF86_18445 [Ornithinibacillus massiliensis]|uniref:Uncharacterized protein n=1 Tax=Ornithinibacillus massiliensis TaxID=1944633 RepID=A0ABS5MIL7_9BACI|nr:hypothetical protein [Ornithinibacillus massiliensis]MBS3682176.1 hypothetical protein [Ornithinibacillus massiliensis]